MSELSQIVTHSWVGGRGSMNTLKGVVRVPRLIYKYSV